MIKTKILTKQNQSVDINIIDTLEAANATISILRHLRERYEIDRVAHFDRNHRPRCRSRRVDVRPETATNLPLQDFYRKEVVQVLDVQINVLTENVQVACDTLAPTIRLFLPQFTSDRKPDDVKSFAMMLPESNRSDDDLLCVELTLFRHHCQNSKVEIKMLKEAACFAKE